MSISAIASTAPMMLASRTPETMEGPSPDHDGDADDQSASASPAISQAAPGGMGAVVNTKA